MKKYGHNYGKCYTQITVSRTSLCQQICDRLYMAIHRAPHQGGHSVCVGLLRGTGVMEWRLYVIE
jgi:hypothetical protein